MARFRAIGPWILALVLIFVAGECVARLDDWAFNQVPFFAHPHRDRDLILHDDFGVRGRPHGVFKKWKLNQFGFRGPEIDESPAQGTTRVLILGASETFGLYESAGHEYPAQVREQLRIFGHSNIEVVNVAMAGITIKSMKPYWDRWLSRFGAKFVVLYPSPLFYLDDTLPKEPGEPSADRGPSGSVKSRFAERVVDTVKQADLLRRMRARYAAWRFEQTGEATFHDVPPDRLEAYLADVEALMHAIRAKGAVPILVTHATKSKHPPRPEDMPDLEAFRIFFQRAEPLVLSAFEDAANQKLRAKYSPLLEIAEELSGERELFADLVHFNDRGSERMAKSLTRGLLRIVSEHDPRRGEF